MSPLLRLFATICWAAFGVAFASLVSAAGPKAYVGNFKDNTVSVIDIATGTVIATVPVAAGPHGISQTPDGCMVYVSGDGSSQVNVIDTATDRVAKTLDVGKSPHGMAVSPDGRTQIDVSLTLQHAPDGRTLLIGVYGEDRIAFVDTATQSIVASLPVAKVHTIAMRPDGKVAYAASQDPGKFALVVVDLASRQVARTLPLDKPPRDPEFAADGSALYFTLAGVNAVQVLDPATDKIVAQIPTGASPHIAAVFARAPVGTVVVQGPSELLLFDPATRAPLRSVAVGKQPNWMAATADGQKAYVTNEGSNDVTVVDLATGATTTIPVGNAPRRVLIQRVASATSSGPKVSIANFAFVPAEIQIAPGETVTWTNDDGAPHGLAYNDGAKGTDVLLPGASFQRVYDQPGTYDYVCAVHPYMTGKVVVRGP